MTPRAGADARPTEPLSEEESDVSEHRDSVGREVLPIPDRRRPSLTTYDAKDPDTSFPPIGDRQDLASNGVTMLAHVALLFAHRLSGPGIGPHPGRQRITAGPCDATPERKSTSCARPALGRPAPTPAGRRSSGMPYASTGPSAAAGA